MKTYIVLRDRNSEKVMAYVLDQQPHRHVYSIRPRGMFCSEFDTGELNDGGMELAYCILGDFVEPHPGAMPTDLPRLLLCELIARQPLKPAEHWELTDLELHRWMNQVPSVRILAGKKGAAA